MATFIPSPRPATHQRRRAPVRYASGCVLLLVLAACGGAVASDPTPIAVVDVAATLSPVPGGATASAPDLTFLPVASPSGSGSPVPGGVFGSPAPSIAPSGLDGATIAAVQRVIDGSRARIPAPALSVAIRLADGSTWAGVSGDRQLTPARPVDADTVFSIASITKTFVAAAVLQLVDEDRLALDDPLSRWLPDFPRAKRITIRELLSHTSGIFNYFEDPRYNRQVYADTTHRWTLAEILRMVRAPYCDPGDCFVYSNTNFVLLGRIVELITGRPLPQVLKDRFFDKLGLAHTVFQPDQPTPRDAAHGYLWGGGDTFIDQTRSSRVLPHVSAASVAWAAGAIASTPSDIAAWAAALYGGDVVSAELRDQMLTFRPRDEYGLGTRTRIFNGRRGVGHGGSLRGYENEVWYFPREGVTIAMFSNRGLWDPDRTMRLLARALFARIAVPPPEYAPTRNTH